METLLVRLMLLAALTQFGMTLAEFTNCRGRACVQRMEKRARDVLRVEWKPISVWPEEGKRFR